MSSVACFISKLNCIGFLIVMFKTPVFDDKDDMTNKNERITL